MNPEHISALVADKAKVKERIKRLDRRMDFLSQRIGSRGRTSEANGHDKAELSALNCVVEIVEGVIQELEHEPHGSGASDPSSP
jgi:hypothetical protein